MNNDNASRNSKNPEGVLESSIDTLGLLEDNGANESADEVKMEERLESQPESTAPDYRDPTGEYIPVSIEGLSTGIATDLDLFTRAGDAYFVIKGKNQAIDQRLLAKLKQSQLPYAYIHKSERDKYTARLEAQVSAIVKSPKASLREKAGVLTDLAVEIVDQLFVDPGNPRSIDSAKKFTQEAVLFVGQNKHAFLHLVELSNHDHYTYAHSVGVAAYTLALAPQIMKLDPQQLADIGLAGLLHDIGKCMVDPAIINKKGPLNEDEWAVMKKHPEYGAEIIKRHKNLSPIILAAAEGHHENLMGTGYPKGLQAQKMDPLVRMVALTDAFSALTTKRSYSTPRDSLTALKLIKENLNKKFDNNMFQPFVTLFLEPTKQLRK